MSSLHLLASFRLSHPLSLPRRLDGTPRYFQTLRPLLLISPVPKTVPRARLSTKRPPPGDPRRWMRLAPQE